MTLASYDSRLTLPTRRLPQAARAFGPLVAVFARIRLWHERRANARALESLPFEARKDLGWPAVDRSVPLR
ncbi:MULTISPECIES: hypothetical protein [Alphaproteobacteria]|uniref:DUF1127 domain-containing protein n=2 Tax=Alphaproteobacteria TaxID=28211 RepID=A0A512HD82_9HYPH|nr:MULTISPECIES: hypothetical protein [Alphaproteobacteria]GEO83408.1 hypothetical protein RNA01_03400 [Ciceribacter naphthalenivorans]GLR23019.1 hypothetical protein GCM10007920_28070 [Ciceribacter naphthalenivorans]GLT05875.1 hypothetical protein GCM10007926_28070 [Sphingomonas psychrolutea]